MTISRTRIRAIVRKELRTYRHNRSMIAGMAIIPAVFLVQPLVAVFALQSSSAAALHGRHELLYMLGIPALVPATLAAYAIVGERQSGTLEPLLSTPIQREELVLAKALAVLAPSVLISYVVYAVFIALVELFANAGIASALIHGPDVLAQLIYTPLLAIWSIWIGIAISTRTSEVRVAQQLSALASLPAIAMTTLISLNVVHPTTRLAIGLAVVLLAGIRLGWRGVSALFERERLITGR